MTRRIGIVLNPRSGRGQTGRRRPELERLLAAAVARLPQSDSVAWEIRETTVPGQANALAAEFAAQGMEVVAAAGGDGTLNEVLNGVMGTDARLAVLPLGTGNDFARCIGIGTDLPLAVETLLQGTPKPIDVGQVHGRYFINVAGCGFDAVVAERVNRGFRLLRGTAAYLAAVLQTLFSYHAAQFRLTLDGETVEQRLMLCSVANATSYGGGMQIAPAARLDDSLFDLCLLAEAGKREFLLAFPRVFSGTHLSHPKVTMRRARCIHIETDPPLPVLADGEIFGTTPVEFTLLPHAIEFLFPTG